MATDLERLKAWMAETKTTAAALGRATGMSRPAMSMMLNGKRPFSSKFVWNFFVAYGAAMVESIFQDDRKRGGHPMSDPVAHPEKYAARRAVGRAILDGEMQPAKSYKCAGCDNAAVEYHHPSYRPEDHLNVIPVCRKCHRALHNGKLSLRHGVVPTQVGLVRIAIASQ